MEAALFGCIPFPEHVRTPLLPPDQLESFGCGRACNVDLAGVTEPRAAEAVPMACEPSTATASAASGDVAAISDPEPAAVEAMLGLGAGLHTADEVAELDARLAPLLRRSHVSTRRERAGAWLARKQNLPKNVAPVRSEQEVALFVKLLPEFLNAKTVNWDKFCTAYNACVLSVCDGATCGACVSGSTHVCTSTLQLKTPALLKTYGERISERLHAREALQRHDGGARMQQLDMDLAAGAALAVFPAALPLPPAHCAGAASAPQGASLTLPQAALGPPLLGLPRVQAAVDSNDAAYGRWRSAAIQRLPDAQAHDVLSLMQQLAAAEQRELVRGGDRQQQLAALRKYLERARGKR